MEILMTFLWTLQGLVSPQTRWFAVARNIKASSPSIGKSRRRALWPPLVTRWTHYYLLCLIILYMVTSLNNSVLVPNSTKLTRIVTRDGPGTKIFATLYFLCCKVHRLRQVASDRAHVVHCFFVIRTCAKTRRSRGNVGRAAMFMRLRFRFSNLLC